MQTFLVLLVALAAFATAGVLLAGIVNLARADGNPQRSNKLMRWRVGLQALALAFFVVLLLLSR